METNCLCTTYAYPLKHESFLTVYVMLPNVGIPMRIYVNPTNSIMYGPERILNRRILLDIQNYIESMVLHCANA